MEHHQRRAIFTAVAEPEPTSAHQARNIQEAGAPANSAASSRWWHSSAWQRLSSSSKPSGQPY
jgi:hypothetical protein